MPCTETPRSSLVNRIETWLRDQIATGALPRGAKLPSISELQQQFGAKSANTIQTAQQRLIRDGLIEAHHGRGVFVRSSRDPNAPVRRIGPPQVEVIDPAGPITIKITITAAPPLWDTTRFNAAVAGQWPTVEPFAAGDDYTAYRVTIDQADLEDTVAEFDCLIAELNASWLTIERPRAMAHQQRWTVKTDRRAAAGDPEAYAEFIAARANSLGPDAASGTAAADALTLARVLRLARDASTQETMTGARSSQVDGGRISVVDE